MLHREVNTGSLAVRRGAAGLLREWLRIFKEKQDVFRHMLTGEQQGQRSSSMMHNSNTPRALISHMINSADASPGENPLSLVSAATDI